MREKDQLVWLINIKKGGGMRHILILKRDFLHKADNTCNFVLLNKSTIKSEK